MAGGIQGGGFVGMEHPDYLEARLDWDLMRDALSSRRVKEGRDKYLPIPSGFQYMQDGGQAAYQAYLTRAKFPPLVEPILRGMAGILNRVEPQIEIPKALEGMLERATLTGDPIEIVYRRIIRELLTTGRAALLCDMPEAGGDLPYLAFYEAERIINWSRDHTFYVLDETRLVREGFVWYPRRRYRTLELNEQGQYQVMIYDYVFEGKDTIQEVEPTLPVQRGRCKAPLASACGAKSHTSASSRKRGS